MKLRSKCGSPRLRRGFSLVEVVIATGLCTYVLLVVAALLPIGVVTFQNANVQIVETEIFNRVWSQFNTTPFYQLQHSLTLPNGEGTLNAVFPASTSTPPTVYYYFDDQGQDVTANGATGATYLVRCTLINSATQSGLAQTAPAVDGGAASTGAALTFIQVQIGFHYDPVNVAAGKTDPRVATRTFLIAKRDTWDGR